MRPPTKKEEEKTCCHRERWLRTKIEVNAESRMVKWSVKIEAKEDGGGGGDVVDELHDDARKCVRTFRTRVVTVVAGSRLDILRLLEILISLIWALDKQKEREQHTHAVHKHECQTIERVTEHILHFLSFCCCCLVGDPTFNRRIYCVSPRARCHASHLLYLIVWKKINKNSTKATLWSLRTTTKFSVAFALFRFFFSSLQFSIEYWIQFDTTLGRR